MERISAGMTAFHVLVEGCWFLVTSCNLISTGHPVATFKMPNAFQRPQ